MSPSVVASEAAGASSRTGAAAGPVQRGAMRGDWRYHAILLIISCGVLLAAIVLSVRGQTQVVLPVLNVPLPELCMSRRMLGLPCPGCGLTRCFISLARGDVIAAWSYNPAGLLLFALVVVQIPLRSWQLWRIRRGLPEAVLNGMALVALGGAAALMIGQWALRLLGVAF